MILLSFFPHVRTIGSWRFDPRIHRRQFGVLPLAAALIAHLTWFCSGHHRCPCGCDIAETKGRVRRGGASKKRTRSGPPDLKQYIDDRRSACYVSGRGTDARDVTGGNYGDLKVIESVICCCSNDTRASDAG